MATNEKAAPGAGRAARGNAFNKQDSTTSILNAWRALAASIDTRLWLARNNAHERIAYHAQRAHWFMQGAWCWVIGLLRIVARWVR